MWEQFIEYLKRGFKSKANCDVDMTLEIMNHSIREKYDEIIVFSDGDFGSVYEYVASKILKKVTVYAPLTNPPSPEKFAELLLD